MCYINWVWRLPLGVLSILGSEEISNFVFLIVKYRLGRSYMSRIVATLILMMSCGGMVIGCMLTLACIW
jgi:hypothetical protein